MKLQLALDMHSIDEALEVMDKTNQYIDIVEIGTPFLISKGLFALEKIKYKFPDKEYLADVKIMDAGSYEADLSFDAGADIVTVLGAAEDVTIEGVVKSAVKYGKKVMVDMIGMQDIKTRAIQLEKMGVNYICVHTSFDACSKKDEQSYRHGELIILADTIDNSKLAVAGGVEPESMIPEIKPYRPEIVVVGSYITKAKDMTHAARITKESIL